MKKTFFILISACLLFAHQAKAQVAYIDEVKALGYVAGQGLACGSSKLDTFEMLARAIIITKAVSNKNQADGMYAYNEAKADAYFSKQMDGFYGCAEVIRRFDRQDIFKATLYADGSVKMPDGQIIIPRQPYDATILSAKNENAREEAQKIYDKGDNIEVGELIIKTEGSQTPVKAKAPGPKVKVNSTKPTTAQTGNSAKRQQPQSNNTAAAKTRDSSGVRHISK